MFNFKLDTLEANEILKFKIPDINKNIEINNNLFNKETSKKILTKLKKINQNYMKLIKEDYEKKLDEFLIKKPLSEFDETLIPFMIIQSEKLYKETPRLIQIICLLYYLEGYENNSGLILEVLTGEGKTLIISFFALYLAIL
jgi:preprotein translocase subunit SecA